jgi:hypothetical protein
LAEPAEVSREEIDTRFDLANAISQAGARKLREGPAAMFASACPAGTPEAPPCLAALNIAGIELGKVLKFDPGHIDARMTRMSQSLEQGQLDQARNDLEVALADRGLADPRKAPETFAFLHCEARRFARYGLIDEALKIADKALDMSDEEKAFRGRSRYFKAVVLGYAARSDRSQVAAAARQLQLAFLANSRFERWYKQDPVFDPVRIRIDAALQQLPEAKHTR